MKIDKTNGVDISRLYQRQSVERAGTERAAVEKPRAGDSVELSDRARELQYYQQKLAELPGARAEVVDRLKSLIREGAYEPDNGKIAEGLLRERGME